MFEWKLADAKNRFSDLVTQALTVGPQRVRRRQQSVVVMSEHDYERLTGAHTDLVSFLLDGPDLSDLDISRDKQVFRDVDL